MCNACGFFCCAYDGFSGASVLEPLRALGEAAARCEPLIVWPKECRKNLRKPLPMRAK